MMSLLGTPVAPGTVPVATDVFLAGATVVSNYSCPVVNGSVLVETEPCSFPTGYVTAANFPMLVLLLFLLPLLYPSLLLILCYRPCPLWLV